MNNGIDKPPFSTFLPSTVVQAYKRWDVEKTPFSSGDNRISQPSFHHQID
jgi:hypothetical protein